MENEYDKPLEYLREQYSFTLNYIERLKFIMDLMPLGLETRYKYIAFQNIEMALFYLEKEADRIHKQIKKLTIG